MQNRELLRAQEQNKWNIVLLQYHMAFGIHWKQECQTKNIAYTFLEMQVLHLILLEVQMAIFYLCHSEQAISKKNIECGHLVFLHHKAWLCDPLILIQTLIPGCDS